MSTGTSHPYISSSKDIGAGKPIITGTRTKVSNVVAYYKLGFSAEDIEREFPHLNLSQIHDSLSYYYEHRDEIDKEIDEDGEDNIKHLLHK